MESTRERPRVAVIGDALIDEIREDGVSHDFVGGAGLNVAVGLSRLGINTTLLAMVGDDADGAAIQKMLARHGVQLRSSPSLRGTSRAVSSRIAGEPEYRFNEAAQHRQIRFAGGERDAMAKAAFVVVSCFPFDDQSQVDALAEAVTASGTRLVIDPNPRRGMMSDRTVFARNVERVGALSFLVKISDDDAQLLYQEPVKDSARRILATGATAVLTTTGSGGASVATDEGITVHVPVAQLPGPVIDTMGAGDATLASVVSSLVTRGVPEDAGGWRAIMSQAMMVAAATCRHKGGLLRLRADAEHSLRG